MKVKNAHVGGQQLPMFTPASTWSPPAELPDLRRVPIVALDEETRDDGLSAGRGAGWAYGAGHICGTAVAWSEGGKVRSVYMPVRHPDTACLDPDAVRRWKRDHIAAGVRFVYHNAPYDVGWGRHNDPDAPIPSAVDDTMCMAVMVDEERLQYNLDACCEWRGLPGKDEAQLREAAASFGYHGADVKKNLWRLPARYVGPYACADVEATLALRASLLPELEREATVDAYQLEMDLVPLVCEMRWRGLRVDLDTAAELRDECLRRRDAVFSDLSSRLDGRKVGMDEIGRWKWLAQVFDQEGIKYPHTEKGQPSFTAGSTGWMPSHPHWLPQLIAKADKLNNFAVKFLQGFIIDYAHRGRLHPTINQYISEDERTGARLGTRTFRFSYSDPALQQMPSRDDELAPLIRACFLPEEGQWWERCDYSQQEYRLMVHFATALGLSKAAEAAAKYLADPRTDFHSMVAEMTGLERKPAKDTNFAKSYGAGVPKFAAMTNKTLEEAQEIMDQYDREMPFVKELNQRCKKLADHRGYIRMLDGARKHFDAWELAWREKDERYLAPRPRAAALATPEWKGRRLRRAFTKDAMNALIQGSAARQTKMAMRTCWREGRVPLLQMHDELDFSVQSREEGERNAEIMREVVKLRVPMQADAEYGRSWGEAKHSWEDRDAA